MARPGRWRGMPGKPSKDDMRKAEKEVGENIPSEMMGLDTEDVGDVESGKE